MSKGAVGRVDELKEQVQQLRTALVTNRTIATAVGLVMERHRMDRKQAFAQLVKQSQRSNTPLSVVALDLVTRAETDLHRRHRLTVHHLEPLEPLEVRPGPSGHADGSR